MLSLVLKIMVVDYCEIRLDLYSSDFVLIIQIEECVYEKRDSSKYDGF